MQVEWVVWGLCYYLGVFEWNKDVKKPQVRRCVFRCAIICRFCNCTLPSVSIVTARFASSCQRYGLAEIWPERPRVTIECGGRACGRVLEASGFIRLIRFLAGYIWPQWV